MSFGDYLDRLTALGISGAAALLSSTIIKSELLPEQLKWLGAAGTVVAACMIAVSFALLKVLKKAPVRGVLIVAVIITCACLIWLRAARVTMVDLNGNSHLYLRGSVLTTAGIAAKDQCKPDSVKQLIECAGVNTIPALYGDSYWHLHYFYVVDYLLLLAFFVALISGLELKRG
jgi:hypothetical protein